MIRPFQADDMQQAIKLLDELRCATPYRMCRPDWTVVVQTMIACMNPTTGMVLVAEHEGQLTGILIATVTPLWWGDQQHGPRMVSDLVFHSKHYGDGRRMLQAMIAWAFELPRVVRVELAVSSGQGTLQSMRRLYESAGLRLEGTLFAINHPKYESMLTGELPARVA